MILWTDKIRAFSRFDGDTMINGEDTMARRQIVVKGEPGLDKHCRPVTVFDARLHQLLDDMAETMVVENGVGLAAPQVGVLRRVVVVLETNVPEDKDEYIIELINPEIIESSGEQYGGEGCLSVPGEMGLVKRPLHVKLRAQNRFGEWFEVEGHGLTARCFCHELDHLEGILFTQVADRMLTEEEMENGEF